MRRTPLFTGLTRLPERAGVPISFWLVGATVPAVAFIVTQSFWVFLLAPILYLVMLGLAKKDAFMFLILFKKLTKTPATRNRTFWGGNSYGS